MPDEADEVADTMDAADADAPPFVVDSWSWSCVGTTRAEPEAVSE
jgi:hypothetical protein